MKNSKNNNLSNKNKDKPDKTASISFKQNLENRSNFDYMHPDKKILKEKRESTPDIDSELDDLL